MGESLVYFLTHGVWSHIGVISVVSFRLQFKLQLFLIKLAESQYVKTLKRQKFKLRTNKSVTAYDFIMSLLPCESKNVYIHAI